MLDSCSRESAALKKCIPDLERAFRMNLNDISVFLYQADVLRKSTYNIVTCATSMYTPIDKAHMILEELSDAVEQDVDVYHKFVDHLYTKPISYKIILKKLADANSMLDQEAGLQDLCNNDHEKGWVKHT